MSRTSKYKQIYFPASFPHFWNPSFLLLILLFSRSLFHAVSHFFFPLSLFRSLFPILSLVLKYPKTQAKKQRRFFLSLRCQFGEKKRGEREKLFHCIKARERESVGFTRTLPTLSALVLCDSGKRERERKSGREREKVSQSPERRRLVKQCASNALIFSLSPVKESNNPRSFFLSLSHVSVTLNRPRETQEVREVLNIYLIIH